MGRVLLAMMAVQAVVAAFFVLDIILDLGARRSGQPVGAHIAVEVLANVLLVGAILFEAEYLRRLLRRQAQAERSLSVAAGALQTVIDGYFGDWGLTPAEADIALFAMKGCSISEIARLRGSAEGTVKTHLNAIYRKAGVSGRAQLVSLLVEDLLGGPIRAPQRTAAGDLSRRGPRTPAEAQPWPATQPVGPAPGPIGQ